MNNYEKIKKFIYSKLQDKISQNGLLESSDISSEIENVKVLLSTPNAPLLVFNESNITMFEDDFKRMRNDLETNFDVKMSEGICIQGEEQQNRDSTWWTGLAKQDSEIFYWNRYKKYIKESLPPEVVRTIDADTDVVMNNLESPAVVDFSRYGMVVGHVQSGKTANYSALICKAADAGYKFIVVIAGGINNLRNQTQERINEAFIGRDGSGNQCGAGIGNSPLNKLPISLTTVEMDFNKQDADKNSQSSNFDNTVTPIVLVIKKNTSTLKNVISWLESQYKNKIEKHSMLMIDDESDYASINTKEEDDPTTINRRLRKLLSLFKKSCYVAYTATPYANIFIDHEAQNNDVGDDLFPKDFIYSLDAPSNYFGARKIFLDPDQKYLVAIDDFSDHIPAKHPKDFPVISIPDSLFHAMRTFILNIAIRNLRGQEKQHNSMLIHATRFTYVHGQFAMHAEEYIDKVKIDVSSYSKLDDATEKSSLIKEIKIIFDARTDVENKPVWLDILNVLEDVLNSIVVREVHQKTKVPLEYRKDRSTNAIVVGGTSVSRGYTLEGLSVSYFLRNTMFYDTLMQMGRWFGFRINYEDLCKVYMSDLMIDNFAGIITATEDLIKDFKDMSEAKKTPNDFGLAVKQHPDSALQITARNKQKNIQEFVFDMKLDGHSKETSWLSIVDKEKNLKCVESIVSKLSSISENEDVNGSILWRNIEASVISDFLNDFKVYKTDQLGLTARMPIAFIKKYVEKRNIKWDVALYSGMGARHKISTQKIKKEKRKVVLKGDYVEIKNRQVSSGNSESIALPSNLRKDLKSERKEIRANLKNPLLMLHVLEPEYIGESLKETSALAAFGISFPGDINSKGETIKLKINTVYYNNLLEAESGESSDD